MAVTSMRLEKGWHVMAFPDGLSRLSLTATVMADLAR
jgi:hypothetical protein